MSSLIGKDLWSLGLAELSKTNVAKVRKIVEKRRQRKTEFRHLIMNDLKEAELLRNVMMDLQTVEGTIPMLPSQKKLRSIPNVLGLQQKELDSQSMDIDLDGPLGDYLDVDAREVFGVPQLRPQQKSAIDRVLTDLSCRGRLMVVQRTGKFCLCYADMVI